MDVMDNETDFILTWLFQGVDLGRDNEEIKPESEREVTAVETQESPQEQPGTPESDKKPDNKTDGSTESMDGLPTSSYYENEAWHSTMNMLSSEHYRALQMLTPEQLELLLKLVYTLRQQRIAVRQQSECRFCKTNGESESWYSCHTLKDRRGRVVCPVLKAYTCPRCGATGTRAHTYKYCPFNNPL